MSRVSRWKLTAHQRRRFQQQLNHCRDARQYRRLLALLEVDRGEPVSQVAKRLGVTRPSVHLWIGACAGTVDPGVVKDQPRSGRPSTWNDTLRGLLREWLVHSPEEFGYSVATWTVPLLVEQFRHTQGEELSEDTLRRELHRQGYTWKRSRYVLEPDPEREKKTPDFKAFEEVRPTKRDLGGR